ncbi:NAD-dependent succinate-semialdehyde dehydrogenase [Mesorhizobium sp. LHD-90]|uniref:NAD-dependent succinate-semialdehyde dehydrogenase n=1 Tax=Mesorhizobium sp. LHD-90 TaxID=3071414 RepID=UPI0027DFF7FE|nr:NAD-dependent succinate-semialdehyde dehydrogenase [Mesorhizobium sp. LHD-90]MDQ6432553.1 NAD-dependent succinate-semialdehyde dehydrogenase [Mesorhizobium sp. LHD-90]
MTQDARLPLAAMLIDGRLEQAQSGETFVSTNPANGEPIARIPFGDDRDARLAVDAAAAAFPAWSKLSAAARAKHLHRLADALERRRNEIALVVTSEEGKPLHEAQGELQLSIDSLRWYAEEARRAYGAWIPDPVPGRRLLTQRQPVGVCGAIIPWNVPCAMIFRKAAPALAAGCTMVLKPAEATSYVALKVAEVFAEAEIPAGVINVVTGKASAIGNVFLTDHRVRKISFTGSTDVGRLLLRGAADQIKRTSMELGGNAPVILFEDCDLDASIRAVASLKFLNAGQACIGANRIYVQSSIYEEVSRRLADHARQMKVGDGSQAGVVMGPLVDMKAVEKVEELVADAVGKGAVLRAGGSRMQGEAYERGCFYAPTVMTGVPRTARLHDEEIFGPVAALYTFETEDEVVDLANNVDYGLSAYIFTENMDRAIRVGEQLESGMVGINETRLGAAEAPFGGVKMSGIGREGGREGLDEYLETKLLAIRVKD